MKPDWKPIETAPKDGTEILAYHKDYDILLVKYTSLSEIMSEDEIERENMDDEDLFQEDWFNADFADGSRMDHCPTHWMPLPKFPLA